MTTLSKTYFVPASVFTGTNEFIRSYRKPSLFSETSNAGSTESFVSAHGEPLVQSVGEWAGSCEPVQGWLSSESMNKAGDVFRLLVKVEIDPTKQLIPRYVACTEDEAIKFNNQKLDSLAEQSLQIRVVEDPLTGEDISNAEAIAKFIAENVPRNIKSEH